MPLPASKIDEYYMRCALELALLGKECSPNPRVGCVLVHDGHIIGKGWHKKYGGPHAEVNAVRDAGGLAAGATAYVTLEPCSHFGKTPPCSDLLIKHGVARVVIGMQDPNPKVDGGGISKLTAAGIEVKTGVLEAECRYMNRGFIRRMREGRPWVTLKAASSLDGKTALENGESKWITGEEARVAVHLMRAESDVVLTGSGTVIADDPMLTVRDAPGSSPARAVLDRRLRVPASAKIFKGGGTTVYTLETSPDVRVKELEAVGARVERISAGEDFLKAVLERLCSARANYLMVEAGGTLSSAFIRSNLCDELALFTAPKLMGRGESYTGSLSFTSMDDVIRLRSVQYARYGCDMLIKGVFECSPDL